MRSGIVATSLIGLLVLTLPLLAPPVEAAKAVVDISLNSVTVVSMGGQTTVTLNVTNNSTVTVKIETNVKSLLCDFAACDLDTTTNQCTMAATGGSEGTLGVDQTADFEVIFALDPDNYLFVAQAVGMKGGSEDKKLSVVAAVVP